jgi:hypothetical protein
MRSLLPIVSAFSISTIIFVNPVLAKTITYQGDKGTYTVDTDRHTYRGCLHTGGCVSLGRKQWIPCSPDQLRVGCQHITWGNGKYTYTVNADPMVIVRKDGKVIFEDVLRE